MSRPSVVIVSPALADANNGNWQTASRWRDMLAGAVDARIVREWPDADSPRDVFMLALHARRSAPSIQAWAKAHPGRGLAVVLTGTDLYRDIHFDADAALSLELAQRLVVLQEMAPQALPAQHRGKAYVVFQSTPSLAPAVKPASHLRAVMVGHLRDVKSPETLFEAARLLADRGDIFIDHVGEASDERLGRLASETDSACANYRWLGGLPHDEVRERIRQAHVLVHTSALEGGAHVVMEAVCSGTPVLASRVDGNAGMLGADYEGYFPHGDSAALARLLARCRGDQSAQDPAGALLTRLEAQCRQRAALFEPAAERDALTRLLNQLDTCP